MTTSPVRLRLGDMLVASGVVQAAQIDEALERQKGTGRRLGEVLVELGHVTEHQLAQVLSNQLSIPWVNLHHVDFSRELLNLVPGELAEKTAVVPVYVRRVRHQGETLFVATDDPMNDNSLALVAAHVGMPVKPMVAGSTDVRNAIRAYYGRELPAPAARLEKKKPLVKSIPPVELSETEIEIEMGEPIAPEAAPAAAAPAEPPADEGAKTIEIRRADLPPPPASADAAEPEPVALATPKKKKKKGGAKFITLTLLDGVKVRLPAPDSDPGEEAEEQLTTRDLVAALLARTQGKDVSKVLPDAHWETLFATLLTILMKKGLVADWEFVEEWNKNRARR